MSTPAGPGPAHRNDWELNSADAFEYTPALSLALERASSYARRRSLLVIEPVHLLHGLLAEAEGRAAVL